MTQAQDSRKTQFRVFIKLFPLATYHGRMWIAVSAHREHVGCSSLYCVSGSEWRVKVNMFAQGQDMSRSEVYHKKKKEGPIQPRIQGWTMREDGDLNWTMPADLTHAISLLGFSFSSPNQYRSWRTADLELAGKVMTKKISIGVDNATANVFIATPVIESHNHFTAEFPNQL